MDLFVAFKQQLHAALTHLYHPAFEPGPLLRTALSASGQPMIQQMLLQAVERLKPTADAPLGTRSHQLYELLYYRYVRALTQEETAVHLHITPRHLRRRQQEAIHLLAHQLWERRAAPRPIPTEQPTDRNATHVIDGEDDFRAQVRQELAALQQRVPGAVAAVAEVLHGVAQLHDVLTAPHGVLLTVNAVEPLMAAIHPTVLRQLLITGIEKLAKQMTRGVIELGAASNGSAVLLTLRATANQRLALPVSALMQEILVAQGGTLHTEAADTYWALHIRLPAAQKAPVLVIDDNQDLVHFYRRYTANTCYDIIHASEGGLAFALAERHPPAAIVLDVMLPDADGWELLIQLQAHPATAGVPIIVCSVVRRAELASALRAALYVAKPVRRQEFIQALDQVVLRAGLPEPPGSANSAIVG
jgi:CheY-like chemotaxis protein